MKIGLCACYDTYNYGSQLQSYASLEVLQELGFDVELIKYKKKVTVTFIVKSFPRIFNSSFVKRRLKICYNKKMRKKNSLYSEIIRNRNQQFEMRP